MHAFTYVDVSKILIILYLTFISVGSLASSSLTVIFLTSKFFCFYIKENWQLKKQERRGIILKLIQLEIDYLISKMMMMMKSPISTLKFKLLCMISST